jgi:hypothetical protein
MKSLSFKRKKKTAPKKKKRKKDFRSLPFSWVVGTLDDDNLHNVFPQLFVGAETKLSSELAFPSYIKNNT